MRSFAFHSRGRKAPNSAVSGVVAAALLAFASVPLGPGVADEVPAGGAVASGAAAIGATAGGLVIDQSSAKAIIDWSSFSIGAGSSVQFNNGSGATLNRVTGANVSSIDGLLSATGSVYLLNPNGIIVGKDGVVQVGGSFIASTLGVANGDFLDGGDTTFAGNSTATVINLGKVGALGGDVALIATEVRNDGDIDAPNGTAALIAGRDVLMRDAALEDGKFVVRVGGSDTSATNTGAINAASAELRANGGNVLALAGNTKGVVRATGVSKSGGRIFLTAGGGSVRVSGKVRATKPGATGNDGGSIVALGKSVTVDGTLDASGDKGGFIETSGDHVDYTGATITAGQGGQWLVDPASLTVDASAATTIMATLNSGTDVTLTTTASSTSGLGVQNLSASSSDIIIANPLSWIGTATLTLNAYNNIAINSAIAATYGGLSLNAGGTISATAAVNIGTFLLTSGAWSQITTSLPAFSANDFRISGGTFSRFAGGTGAIFAPYSVADIYGLQGVASRGSSSGVYYQQTADIDASVTQYWNAGAGFVPIGTNSTPFASVYDGGDHFITSLYINRPTTDSVGLFGYLSGSGAQIGHLNLVRASVTGQARVGALAGNLFQGAFVGNSSSTGTVSGTEQVGGLVGTVSLGSNVSVSYSTANVNATNYVGGLIGWASGTIQYDYASGAVTGAGSGYAVGGLVGFATNSLIVGAYATGAVSGTARVGGLVGDMSSTNVSQAYATGRVSGSSGAGGLFGGVSGGTIAGALWDTDTTTQASAFGVGSAAGTTAMQSGNPSGSNYAFSAATYAGAGWTLDTTMDNLGPSAPWLMIDGETRPFLTTEYSTKIANTHQLQLAAFDLDANYTLATDIDASETAGTNASGMWTTRGFVPIGRSNPASGSTFSGIAYTGAFDGADHIISGLLINRPNENFVGLFGGNGNYIHDVGLVNADVLGWTAVGALVGNNFGLISFSYSGGRVRGNNGVGGLVGISGGVVTYDYSEANVSRDASVNQPYTGWAGFGGLVGGAQGGQITRSYALGSVDSGALDFSGGLVGLNSATIAQVYATGRVSGTGGNIGGIAGYTNATIANSTWDSTTTGRGNPVGGGPTSTVNPVFAGTTALSGSSYSSLGWAISSTMGNTVPATDWLIIDGETRPFGAWEFQTNVTNAHQLQLMTFDRDASYKLTGDINLGSVLNNASQMWRTSAAGTTPYGFVPIALSGTAFTGALDGGYHTISGLSIVRPSSTNVGLFGATQGVSLIANLTLSGVSVSGSGQVGALIGQMSVSGATAGVSRVSVAGNVSAPLGRVGGIVGYATISATAMGITRSAFAGTVAAGGSSSDAGGIAGIFSSSSGAASGAADLISSGSVSAGSDVGGIFGSITDVGTMAIQNVSTSSNVTSTGNAVGGLIGQLVATSGGGVRLLDSFATGTVSSTGSNVGSLGGLVGYASASAGSVLISRTYATGAVDAPSGSYVGGLIGQATAGNNSTTTVQDSFATGTLRAYDTDGGLIGFIFSNGANSSINVLRSYSTGAVRSVGSAGALIGQAYTSQASSVVSISQSYATGDIVNLGAGLIGSTSSGTVSITSSYWDKDTTGQPTSAGLPNSNGVTTAVLQSALPAGFDSSVWGILPGVSYPYLKWRFPTGPSVISGTVAGVSGGNGALAVTVADAGTLLGTAYTGANGYYYFATDPIGVADPTLTYLTGVRFPGGTITERGNAVSRTDAARQATGMNIDAGWVNVRSPLTTLTSVQTNQMAAAKGSLSDAAIRYAVSGSNLGLVAGTSLRVTVDNSSFAIDTSLASNAQFVITNTGDLVINPGASIQSTASGTAITLATGGKFTNNGGSLALSDANGRWLVWSTNPANDTRGGLVYGFKQYNATYGVTTVADATHNGFLYSIAPVLTPTAFADPISKQYDGTASTDASVTATGAIDGDVVSVVVGSATYNDKNVGGNKPIAFTGIVVSATNAGGDVYGYQQLETSAYALGTITPAYLTITPSSGLTKVYGDADPTIGYSVGGTVFAGDSVTGSLTRASGESVGPYSILLGSVSAGSNYALNLTPTNFSITQATLHVAADHKTKVYGDSDPALTYVATTADFKNGDTSAIITGALSRTGDENVGDKAITQGTLSAGANYIVAYTGNTLTITQATLHVAADHKTKVYGDSDPALTYVATSADFKNGDTSAVITGALSRTGDENVGDKAITQGTLSAGANYIVAYTGNTLTI
ncbi:MAG TPA: MBG domain-containing protein, partial [Bauldia sp.]|nr:MBG domain-containing protein [Bauldia sp.]